MSIEYSPFRAWQVFNAVKLHYTSNFDIAKYGTSSKTLTVERFKKTSAKYTYEKMYNKFRNCDELTAFLSVAFYENNIKTPVDLFDAFELINLQYLRQKKILANPEYHVNLEFSNIIEHTSFSKFVSNPLDVFLYVKNKNISVESLIILDKSFSIFKLMKWDENNPIHCSFRHKLSKYSAFIGISKEQSNSIRKACKQTIERSQQKQNVTN